MDHSLYGEDPWDTSLYDLIICIDNLPVDNAVDVLPAGGKIRVQVKKDKQPGYVLVTVQDDGPGIPEHIQGRIFEPFFTTKGQSKGTGLGLSVSRGIIKKLGGYIHLTSSPDSGTTFTVSLPTTDSPSEIMSK